MSNPIVHFEIPADDVQRAKKFYEEAFGWKISDPWNMNYFLVETRAEGEAGINGGLMPRQNPGQPFMNYINVDSIDEAWAKRSKQQAERSSCPREKSRPAWDGSPPSRTRKEIFSASTRMQNNCALSKRREPLQESGSLRLPAILRCY